MHRRMFTATAREVERHGLFWLTVALAAPLVLVPPHHFVTWVLGGGAASWDWLRFCVIWLRSPAGAGWMVVTSLVLLAAGAVRAGRRLGRLLHPSRRDHLPLLAGEAAAVRRARDIAARFGIRTPVLVIASARPIAATRGWWRPVILVSAGLVEALTDDELAAVLIHEESHAANRDPLRTFVLQTVAEGLFFLPVLRKVTAAYQERRELDADALAFGLQRDWRPLASALLKVLAGSAAPAGPGERGGLLGEPVSGFASTLEARLRRLVAEPPGPRRHTAVSRYGAAWWLQAAASTPALWLFYCATRCMGIGGLA